MYSFPHFINKSNKILYLKSLVMLINLNSEK
jgi:hypothetical protein